MATQAPNPDRTPGENSLEDGRESIWSVPPGRMAQYLALFTLFASMGLGFLLWYEIFSNTSDTLPQTVLAIIKGLGLNTAGAAGLSFQIVEGPKFVMVVADYFTKRWLNPLKEQLRQEGRAEGRAEGHAEGRAEGQVEGRAETNAEWEAWNARRMEAEEKGEPFDEPPPSADSLD